MRYSLLASVTIGLSITVPAANADMSPDVKAHLCELAKRDAAITPEEIEQHEQARSECIASVPPEEPATLTSTCTAQGAKHVFAGIHRQARVICESTITETGQVKECPEPTRKLRKRMESAPERIAEYCTEN